MLLHARAHAQKGSQRRIRAAFALYFGNKSHSAQDFLDVTEQYSPPWTPATKIQSTSSTTSIFPPRAIVSKV
jgi:hypothetical protein